MNQILSRTRCNTLHLGINRIVGILLVFFCIATFPSFGKVKDNLLDSSFVKCEYEVICYKDTIKFDKAMFTCDYFILQIGYNYSKYYSKNTDAYLRLKADSEAWRVYNNELMSALNRAKSRGTYLEMKPLARNYALVIYTNHSKDSRTVIDDIFTTYYIYDEKSDVPKWEIISDSTQTVLGYECKKAVGDYRGRKYETWFATEIPISQGPWKLSGLPGLILKARDTQGHYEFLIKGIEKKVEGIYFTEYPNCKCNKTNRILLLQKQAKANRIGLKNYYGAVLGNGIHDTNVESVEKFDLLERDYYLK